MTTLNRIDENSSKRRVYMLRKSYFQKNLVQMISVLGFILIVLPHIKYGTSLLVVFIRYSIQVLLTKPFPDDEQLLLMARRIQWRTNHGRHGENANTGESTDDQLSWIPGAFQSTSTNVATVTEAMEQQTVIASKKSIRTVLFHSSLTLNIIFLVWALFHPTDFAGKLDGKIPTERGFNNAASPFYSQRGLLEGEFRGSFLLHLIGNPLPTNNITSNLGILFYNLLILMAQFTLFTLTCINFSGIDYKEPFDDRSLVSDGYDGTVFVIGIDHTNAINIMLRPRNEIEDR
ncbi:Gld1p KNAG_0A07590 [Huiozyma naganishii CBS 8797]|uniref:DUF1746 domain-containing protein n=1 Tax=Huiozyma naganishii (strain ATCC MYA-139 / BCRC 22969 / CBS 8797 / KCTC 17520 / NBRC 10181 / NCYC 3082 / Yp74L-3) TaxID=1071383 RepID=J7RUB1_HUIN7|nr:hypothetical protein KNAG_0A07590 [Kazachstania naganishii CBS 8797]CCK68412.1 hypothetical protein KNAG_0A07590 [Kazachstania naganishii CBS 8797]